MATLRLMLPLLLVSLLTACGWQLRGTGSSPQMESLTLRGGSPELRYALEDALQYHDVLVHDQSPYILVIKDEEWQKRTAAVDRQGRQAETELRYSLKWHLEERDTQALLTAPQRLAALRSFAYLPGNATASSDEEQLIRDDLQGDLIFRLINQLAHTTQNWEAR